MSYKSKPSGKPTFPWLAQLSIALETENFKKPPQILYSKYKMEIQILQLNYYSIILLFVSGYTVPILLKVLRYLLLFGSAFVLLKQLYPTSNSDKELMSSPQSSRSRIPDTKSVVSIRRVHIKNFRMNLERSENKGPRTESSDKECSDSESSDREGSYLDSIDEECSDLENSDEEDSFIRMNTNVVF